MRLYQKDGWFDAAEVISQPEDFIFCTGARGTGKTYGTLKYLIKNMHDFIYLRRTQDEADMQRVPELSSLTKIIHELNLDCRFSKIGKKVGVCSVFNPQIEYCRIYCCGLSTFSTIRGVDFSHVKYIVYDEMIPEAHAHKIKLEGLALQNLYETVNRNRELEGQSAVKFIGLSNSLNIANDVFIEFDLISDAERLLSSGEEYARLGNKLLIIMQHSPISEKKKETALYQAGSDQFKDMAISNKFILNDFSYVKKRSVKEYFCVMQIGDLYVYEHKSNDEFYITFTRGQTRNVYTTSANDLKRLRREEWNLYCDYLDGFIRFENYRAVSLFEKYFSQN